MKHFVGYILICVLFLVASCEHSTKPEYENTVAAVEILPEDGNLPPEHTVSMSVATPEAEIRYTTDGSDPGLASPRYSSPFTLTGTGRKIVKARAFKENWNPSPVSQRQYYVSHAQPDMIFVPGGSFFNGICQVSLNSFYLDKTEVTQEEYYAVMGSLPVPLKQSEYPVYYVSWLDAVEYCNRRSMLDGLNPVYTFAGCGTNPENWPADYGQEATQSGLVACNWAANGYRLPKDMESLYAYLGGQQSHNYLYSGSNDWEEVCWCNENSGHSVHPVGTKTINELGFYDLSGNLWEWCWDLRQDDKESVDAGSPKTQSRSVRGGSWYSPPGACNRYASAAFDPACDLAASIGFRCCRSGD